MAAILSQTIWKPNKLQPFCRKPFEKQTIPKPNDHRPSEFRTRSEFEPPLYSFETFKIRKSKHSDFIWHWRHDIDDMTTLAWLFFQDSSVGTVTLVYDGTTTLSKMETFLQQLLWDNCFGDTFIMRLKANVALLENKQVLVQVRIN